MKIDLNLGVHQSAHERYALYWAIPAALASLVALAYLTSVALRNIRLYHEVSQSVAECQAQQNLLRAREMASIRRLQQPEFQGVLRQASYVNSLIDQRRLSLTGLTAKITELLPPDVHLTSLALTLGSEGPLVRMTVESSSQEQVIAFVENLEESPDFADPVISSEDPGREGVAPPTAGEARMVCAALYKGWQGPVTAEGNQKSEVRSQKRAARSKK